MLFEAGRAEEKLRDEAMVRDGGLVVGAVRQHLNVHFVLDGRTGKRRPFRARRQIGEDGAQKQQPDDVAEEVIACNLVGVLKVVTDEDAVVV